MWKQKLGLAIGNNNPVPTEKAIQMVADAKFDAISFDWQDNVNLSALVKIAHDCGLIVQSLHATYGYPSR